MQNNIYPIGRLLILAGIIIGLFIGLFSARFVWNDVEDLFLVIVGYLVARAEDRLPPNNEVNNHGKGRT